MESIPSPVGPNLRKHRRNRELTLERVAFELEVTVRTVQRWEANDTTPGWKDLLRLAHLYDTTVAEFFVTPPAREDGVA